LKLREKERGFFGQEPGEGLEANILCLDCETYGTCFSMYIYAIEDLCELLYQSVYCFIFLLEKNAAFEKQNLPLVDESIDSRESIVICLFIIILFQVFLLLFMFSALCSLYHSSTYHLHLVSSLNAFDL